MQRMPLLAACSKVLLNDRSIAPNEVLAAAEP